MSHGLKLIFLLLLLPTFAFAAAPDHRISDNDGDVMNVNSDGTVPVAISGNLSLPGNLTVTSGTTSVDDLTVVNGKFVMASSTIASDATTVNVSSANIFRTSPNTVPTSITSITGATADEIIYFIGGSDINGTSFDDTGVFNLNASVRLSADDVLVLIASNDATFNQIAYSNN